MGNNIFGEIEIMEQDNNSSKYMASTPPAEQDVITIVCEKMQAIDFSVNQSNINISPEVDALYREAYLNILKNKIPTTNNKGKKEYFRNLYKIGTEFEQLDEYYCYYYDDLDGDGLPELGIKSTGCTYILKYESEINEFIVLFKNPTMYMTILGTGQIWYHDGLHAGIIREEYIVLSSNNEWETIFKLEQGGDSPPFYYISIGDYINIDVGEALWRRITKPFFEATQNAVSSQSLEEVFGKLL